MWIAAVSRPIRGRPQTRADQKRILGLPSGRFMHPKQCEKNEEVSMKKSICLASIALLSCSSVMAQSTDSSAQGTSTVQQSTQGTSSTPPGDRRDRYGDTIAPDGTATPKGSNTVGKSSSDVQPSSTSNSAPPNVQGTGPTPTGDRRDRYGDTIAPDGTATPKGANTFPAQTTAPDTK